MEELDKNIMKYYRKFQKNFTKMEDDRFRTIGNRDAVSSETGKHMKKEEIITALASGASVLTAGIKRRMVSSMM